MKKHICFALILLFAIFITGCTKQTRVKTFGGTEEIYLEPNEKLVNTTWKESNLWFLTRPMKSTDTVETYKFYESSRLGVFEGTLVIHEVKK